MDSLRVASQLVSAIHPVAVQLSHQRRGTDIRIFHIFCVIQLNEDRARVVEITPPSSYARNQPPTPIENDRCEFLHSWPNHGRYHVEAHLRDDEIETDSEERAVN